MVQEGGGEVFLYGVEGEGCTHDLHKESSPRGTPASPSSLLIDRAQVAQGSVSSMASNVYSIGTILIAASTIKSVINRKTL